MPGAPCDACCCVSHTSGVATGTTPPPPRAAVAAGPASTVAAAVAACALPCVTRALRYPAQCCGPVPAGPVPYRAQTAAYSPAAKLVRAAGLAACSQACTVGKPPATLPWSPEVSPLRLSSTARTHHCTLRPLLGSVLVPVPRLLWAAPPSPSPPIPTRSLPTVSNADTTLDMRAASSGQAPSRCRLPYAYALALHRMSTSAALSAARVSLSGYTAFGCSSLSKAQ